MSTPDPLDDFYLPGPAAKELPDGRESLHIRPDEEADEAVADEDDFRDRFEHDADDEIFEAIDELPEQTVREDDDSDGYEFDRDDEAAADELPSMAAAQSQRARPASTEATAVAGRGRGGLLLALLIAAALAAGVWYLAQPQTLPIRQVNIEGEFQQLSQAELQQLVAGELHGGFFSIDVAGLRKAVKLSPWVRDVQVQRVWPDALKVAVREQTAVARWRDSGLVNSAGQYFQPDMSTVPTGLPQLNGPQDMQAELTERLLQLQKGLAPLDMHVKRLTLSERRAWSFETSTGLEVVLGREDFDARLQRFIDLVPASLGERLANAAYIDMRYTNGFAVQFNQDDSGAPDKGPNEGNGAA